MVMAWTFISYVLWSKRIHCVREEDAHVGTFHKKVTEIAIFTASLRENDKKLSHLGLRCQNTIDFV